MHTVTEIERPDPCAAARGVEAVRVTTRPTLPLAAASRRQKFQPQCAGTIYSASQIQVVLTGRALRRLVPLNEDSVVSQTADCDRTVICGCKNPQEYGGLQGHTERYFQAANSLMACVCMANSKFREHFARVPRSC